MIEVREEGRKPVERECVLFLLTKDNRFLTELRVKKGSGFYGRFRIPGGEIEDGELPAQAAFRECFEEHGVVVKDMVHLDTFEEVTLNNQLVRLHAFLITNYIGEPRQLEPGKSLLYWFDENVVFDKLTLASSRLVLNKATQYLSGQNR
jgi:8-oxo-dGTP pyrophosphatase MutT (NUDIX family)